VHFEGCKDCNDAPSIATCTKTPTPTTSIVTRRASGSPFAIMVRLARTVRSRLSASERSSPVCCFNSFCTFNSQFRTPPGQFLQEGTCIEPVCLSLGHGRWIRGKDSSICPHVAPVVYGCPQLWLAAANDSCCPMLYRTCEEYVQRSDWWIGGEELHTTTQKLLNELVLRCLELQEASRSANSR